MQINGMVVKEANGLYYIFSTYGELKSIHYLPEDGQLLANFKTLELITRAEALRWGLLHPKKKCNGCDNIHKISVSSYAILLAVSRLASPNHSVKMYV